MTPPSPFYRQTDGTAINNIALCTPAHADAGYWLFAHIEDIVGGGDAWCDF